MTDYNGQITVGSAQLTEVSGSPDPIPSNFWVGYSSDQTRPTITNITPAAGSPIARNSPLEFDITDNNGMPTAVVFLQFAGYQAVEVAWDGNAFTPLFASISTSQVIPGGRRLSLVRAGGWPGAPTVKIVAVDAYGNQV